MTYTALPSQEICQANADEEFPFGAYSARAGIAPGIRELLQPYASSPIRSAGRGDPAGLCREEFTEVWQRYTPRADPSRDPEASGTSGTSQCSRGTLGVPHMSNVPEQRQPPERENAHEHGDVPDVLHVLPFRRPLLHARAPKQWCRP